MNRRSPSCAPCGAPLLRILVLGLLCPKMTWKKQPIFFSTLTFSDSRCYSQCRPGAHYSVPQESEGLRVDEKQSQLWALGGRGDLQSIGKRQDGSGRFGEQFLISPCGVIMQTGQLSSRLWKITLSFFSWLGWWNSSDRCCLTAYELKKLCLKLHNYASLTV